METVATVAAVRARARAWHAAGARIGLVPTMGNLHAGHLGLLAVARAHAERVVATVFVNPLQFGPHEDFALYPRSLREDQRLLAEAHCDLLFAPPNEEIYPDGGQTTLVHVRGLSEMLCGQLRPGHFDGVATIVAKLFGIVTPDVAVFGDKDYQQLLVIRRMTADLSLPVEIIGAPTVRTADGLALSSRNRYLTENESARAPVIHQVLRQTIGAIAAGDSNYEALEGAGAAALTRAGMQVDYFSIRDAADLSEPRPDSRELAVLAAAWLGGARLIDNLRVRRPASPLEGGVADQLDPLR